MTYLEQMYNDLAVITYDLLKSELKGTEVKSTTFNKKKGVTTVVLKNGTKGIAKVAEGDEYDEKVGFALAYCYALFGSKTKFNKEVAKHSSLHC